MNRREEYKTIHQNSLRFLRDAKNLPYLTNKKVIPYQIINTTTIDVSGSLKKIQTLFQKKFSDFDTDVSLIAGLSFSCPSMLFQVNLKNGTKVYESLTISVSESEESNGTASWPLLLVLKQPKKDTLLKIHQFVQRTFKCNLRPIQLTESQVLWLIGITVNETLKRNLNCGMSLTCKLPTKSSAEIDIYFNEDALSALWDSAHDSVCDVIQFEEITMMFNQMMSHINNVYGINVSQLNISSFLLKGIRLQFYEQINAAKPEMIYLLLSFIVSDCLAGD